MKKIVMKIEKLSKKLKNYSKFILVKQISKKNTKINVRIRLEF